MRQRRSQLTRRIAIIAVTALLAWWGAQERSAPTAGQLPTPTPAWQASDDPLLTAFLARSRNVQIESEGVVERLLPDDHDGSRHQRFILRGPSGHTVLVAHNIDLAPRVKGLAIGDRVSFHGEYEWTERGGVIHWTHHDPRGRHVGGWLEYRGRRYE